MNYMQFVRSSDRPFTLRAVVAAAATLVAVFTAPEIGCALDVNVTNYSWLQLPAADVTPVLYSGNNTTGTSFGQTTDYRWGDYLWLPSNAMTANGSQMYAAGVQLDQSHNIQSVRLQWWTNGSTFTVSRYYIDGSNDGIGWTQIADQPTATPGNLAVTTAAVTPGDYQYVRVRLNAGEYSNNGHSEYGGPGFVVIEPIGNGAVNSAKVNWANSQFGTTITHNGLASYPGTLYTNGSLQDASGPGWTGSAVSGPNYNWPAGEYTQINLGQARLIDNAIVAWANDYTGDAFDLQYSLDGTNYFSVTNSAYTQHSTAQPNIGATERSFDPVIAQYFRISNASSTSTRSHVLINQLLLHSPEEGVLASNPGINGEITLLSLGNNQTFTLEGGLELENTGALGSAIAIFDYDITGPDAAAFDLVNFTPEVILAGDSVLLDLELTTPTAGNYSALLTLNTSIGDVTFNLASAIVPEPTSASLLTLGAVGLAFARRRRK